MSRLRPYAILLLLTLLPAAAHAAEEPPIVLVAPTPPPDQPRVPPQTAKTEIVLTGGNDYYLESNVPCFFRHSTQGVVAVTPIEEKTRPLAVSARFADNPSGTRTTRTFRQPYVYSVAPAAGTGTTDLVVIPSGVRRDDQILTRTFRVVGSGPPAPVDPPRPAPTPVDPPPPFPGDGFRVLVIYESAEVATWPQEQTAILTSQEVRKYLNAKCARVNNHPEWRFLDKDQSVAQLSEPLKAAFAVPSAATSRVVISNGRTGAVVPLPRNEAEMIALLKKYGGE